MPGTKIIDDFSGRLTRNNVGDLNSGLAKFATTFGNNPFGDLTNLTWYETPIQIDPNYTVITDIIMAGRVRLESGITYVYAIGHTGRLYKIQVNNPTTSNPDYDTPVLLTTLTINSPTFKYGSSIQFFGSTPHIYVGHDLGVTQVNFDGSGEAFIGTLGSYTANVPRASAQFVSTMFFGNGNNILSIDSSLTVVSYGVFPGALGTGTYVRDIDVSPDGNYLQMVVSTIPPSDLTALSQDTNSLASADSYLFLWNGTDINPTSFSTFSSHILTANQTFGPFSYTFGYDTGGTAVYESQEKILTLPNILSPGFGGTYSSGRMVNFMTMESTFRQSHPTQPNLQLSLFNYGVYDEEFKVGLYRPLRTLLSFGDPGGDKFTNDEIRQVPLCLPVSNLLYGQNAGSTYTLNQIGSAKIYFSAVGSGSFNGNPAAALYRFDVFPIGLGTALQGVYETQQETSFKLFHSIVSKKFKITSIRFYVNPLVANNSFLIDLIGSDGNPMNGGSFTFTVGTNCNIGQDYLWYTPQTAGTYSIGVRFTNLGTANWTGVKMELDYLEAGI